MNTNRTRIKICGITRTEDALIAVSLGVDALGLVFYKPSPRAVSISQAQEIVNSLPAFISKVGLFVDAEANDVKETLEQVNLDYLQFHGDENEEYCASFGKPYIKAIRVKKDIDLSASVASYKSASGLLLDAWHPNLLGGTGEVFDWTVLKDYKNMQFDLILAGGLDSGNVAEAIDLLKPYAVDVSSGVEVSAGIKSAAKIQDFVKEVSRVRT